MSPAPVLAGVHHLKLPVRDLARSRDWYASRLGYEVAMEFVEGGELVGTRSCTPTVALAWPYASIRRAPKRRPASTTSPSASRTRPRSRISPTDSPVSVTVMPACISPPSGGSCQCSTILTATRSASTRSSTTRTSTPPRWRPCTIPGRPLTSGRANMTRRAGRDGLGLGGRAVGARAVVVLRAGRALSGGGRGDRRAATPRTRIRPERRAWRGFGQVRERSEPRKAARGALDLTMNPPNPAGEGVSDDP